MSHGLSLIQIDLDGVVIGTRLNPIVTRA